MPTKAAYEAWGSPPEFPARYGFGLGLPRTRPSLSTCWGAEVRGGCYVDGARHGNASFGGRGRLPPLHRST